jgi:hypothetical protein
LFGKTLISVPSAVRVCERVAFCADASMPAGITVEMSRRSGSGFSEPNCAESAKVLGFMRVSFQVKVKLRATASALERTNTVRPLA